MKKLLLIFLLLSPLFSIAQAHIGSSLEEIKTMYPDNEFEIAYTKTGIRFAKTSMYYGRFAYYFKKDSDICEFCLQVPSSMVALNAQVEMYNKKYVINSETSWTAFLEGGGRMSIKLEYDKIYQIYTFYYTYPD